MLRRLRIIFCGLCLLLFLILINYRPSPPQKMFGVRYKHTETLPYPVNSCIRTPHFYFMALRGDSIVVGHWHDPQLFIELKEQRAVHERELNWLQTTSFPESHTAPFAQHERLQREQYWIKTYDGHEVVNSDGIFFGDMKIHARMPAQNTRTWRAGISRIRAADPMFSRLNEQWLVPTRFVLLLLLIPPLTQLIPLCRYLRRRYMGRCPSCGYDLRATPKLCPECGHGRAAKFSPAGVTG